MRAGWNDRLCRRNRRNFAISPYRDVSTFDDDALIMRSTPKKRRFYNLRKIPLIAGLDHRYFLDEDGKDTRFKNLSRKERRKLAIEAKKIGREYERIVHQFCKSGAGYPVDKLLRELCLEYTNRYARAGIFSQPINFNYFEPFCEIGFIEDSVAPFAKPAAEHDHLFSIIDYLDYTTFSDNEHFELSSLLELPEGKILHYTTNGNLSDFEFLTPSGREFLVSGFSMVRHGHLLHWYLVGGEVLSEHEWEEEHSDDVKIDIKDISPNKRGFLEEIVEDQGKKKGAPVALEGTTSAIRTVITGETSLITSKHEGRCFMSERENSFRVICDDPDVLQPIRDPSRRDELINVMHERIEEAAVLWNLAEAMFQLPSYFAFRLEIQKSVLVAFGRRIEGRAKGGRGVGVNFRRVAAIEVVDTDWSAVKAYATPHYLVETEGFWRRLKNRDSYGRGPNGERMRGKTWVKSSNRWRERPFGPRTIYVKSSVAAARVTVREIVESTRGAMNAEAKARNSLLDHKEERGVLYVLRCITMKDEVYKVGWTSGTAEERARSLSAATGVPSSFVVVDYWPYEDAEALERNVHAVLDPYRINESREFFQANYAKIKGIIEGEIKRIDDNAR